MRLLTIVAIFGLLLIAGGIAGCGAATSVPGTLLLGGVVVAMIVGPVASVGKTPRKR